MHGYTHVCQNLVADKMCMLRVKNCLFPVDILSDIQSSILSDILRVNSVFQVLRAILLQSRQHDYEIRQNNDLKLRQCARCRLREMLFREHD